MDFYLPAPIQMTLYLPGEGGSSTPGLNGWSPVLAVVADGARRVHQVTDWTGGTTAKPATGQYIGPNGFVSNVAQAVDLRGAAGANGGSDWGNAVLGVDFTTTLATAQDVPGLSFAPVANAVYEIYGRLLLRTALITAGARPGLRWPTAGVSGGAFMGDVATSAAGRTLTNASAVAGAVSVISAGDLPNNTSDVFSKFEAILKTSADVAGQVGITLQSESAGTQVRISAGSFFRWRRVDL